MLINTQYTNEETKQKIKNYLEINESTALQNVWNAVKAVIREKFTGRSLHAYFEEQGKF